MLGRNFRKIKPIYSAFDRPHYSIMESFTDPTKTQNNIKLNNINGLNTNQIKNINNMINLELKINTNLKTNKKIWKTDEIKCEYNDKMQTYALNSMFTANKNKIMESRNYDGNIDDAFNNKNIYMSEYLIFNPNCNITIDLVDRLLPYIKFTYLNENTYQIDRWVFIETENNNYEIKYMFFEDTTSIINGVNCENDKLKIVNLLIQLMNQIPETDLNHNSYYILGYWCEKYKMMLSNHDSDSDPNNNKITSKAVISSIKTINEEIEGLSSWVNINFIMWGFVNIFLCLIK